MNNQRGKIEVIPEGRPGVYVPDRASLLDWVRDYTGDIIHCFVPMQFGVIGTDWDRESVVEAIRNAERLAILTGGAFTNNLKHALSVIVKEGGNEKLRMFDIGDVEEDLNVDAAIMDQA